MTDCCSKGQCRPDEVYVSGLQVAQFFTDSYPAHERIAAWNEALGRHCGVRIDLDPRSAGDFRSSAKMARSSNFGLIEGSMSPARQENSRGSTVNDDITFACVTTARWGVSQLGRSLDLLPKDWSLLSNSDVSVITIPEECRYLAFSVPRAAIRPLVSDIGAKFALRVPASSPPLQMLVRYLDLARRDNVVTTPKLAAAFTDHVCDLLALALGPTREAAEQARLRGLPAARLQAIKDDVACNIGRRDLSVHSVAARHSVSVRYVQKLFEESACTFTQFVMEQRLTAAHKMLAARSSASILSIACDVGFNDVSHFNRSFRQRFGCTPRDVRNAARALGDEGPDRGREPRTSVRTAAVES
jgi:AraC-like DNA-binding protein